jgi:hypothetical protein
LDAGVGEAIDASELAVMSEAIVSTSGEAEAGLGMVGEVGSDGVSPREDCSCGAGPEEADGAGVVGGPGDTGLHDGRPTPQVQKRHLAVQE